MKALLAREEAEHRSLFANILHAIKPIMVEGELPEPGRSKS
jgi:rubrerythrin